MVHDLRTPHIDAVNHLLIASYYLAEFSVVNNNTVYNRNVLIIDNKETQHSILDVQSFSLSSIATKLVNWETMEYSLLMLMTKDF